jgi:hypothetical protein
MPRRHQRAWCVPEVRSAVAPRVVKVTSRTGTKAAGIGADCEEGTKGRAGEVNSQTIGWRASCGCAVGGRFRRGCRAASHRAPHRKPERAFLEHAGAAGGLLDAPILAIEALMNRSLRPRFCAHHHGGAVWTFVLQIGLGRDRCRLARRWALISVIAPASSSANSVRRRARCRRHHAAKIAQSERWVGSVALAARCERSP